MNGNIEVVLVGLLLGWGITYLILALNDRAYRAKQRRMMMRWHGLYGHPEVSSRRMGRRRGATPRKSSPR